LLSNSNGQTTAHAGIILGLIIALGTGGTNLAKVITSNKFRYWFFGILIFTGVILILLFETGRLFYWSGISSVLTYTNKQSVLDSTNSTIVTFNATSYMSLINSYSRITALDAPVITNQMSNVLYPDGRNILLYCGIFVMIVLILGIPKYLWEWRKKVGIFAD
jgi:hypothetical protein